MAFIERLLCAIFGHRYVVAKELAAHTRNVACTRCNGHWAMHDPTRAFVRYDGQIEDMQRRLYPEKFGDREDERGRGE